MVVSSNAYDNPKKRNVRDKISDVINMHGNKEAKMIELLGEGVGLKHYLETINSLSWIIVVERSIENYRKFISSSSLVSLRRKYGENKVFAARVNIDKLFRNKNYGFDIVNLDFCGIFKKQVAHNTQSNVIPAETMFKMHRLVNNGLVFFTYKIGGWLPMGWGHDDILTSPDDISNEIKSIASKYNYELAEVHREVYMSQEGKRGEASKMLSLGFQAKI
jgi:hypothetical protein